MSGDANSADSKSPISTVQVFPSPTVRSLPAVAEAAVPSAPRVTS